MLADCKWILHNCIIFNSPASKLTNIVKNIVKVCKHEMQEIENCPDCYLNAHVKKDTWFTEACRFPHPVVWARLCEPGVFLYVSVQIAVWAVLNFLELVLAHLDQSLCNTRQLAGRRVENDAVVKNPFTIGEHRLRAAILLSTDVSLHALQVHRARDVVLVGGELDRVDRLEERLAVCHRFHPGESVLQKSAQLLQTQ